MDKITFKQLQTMDEVYRTVCWATGETIDKIALSVMKRSQPPRPKDKDGFIIDAHVAYLKRTMIGYIEFDLNSFTRTMILKQLIIAPKYRNKGYGVRLFSSLVSYCRQHRYKTIFIKDPHEKIYNFLRNRGFINYSEGLLFTIPNLQKV